MVEGKVSGCFSISNAIMDDGCAEKLTYSISNMKLEKDHIQFDMKKNDENKTTFTATYTIGDKGHEISIATIKGNKQIKKLKPRGLK